MKIAEYVKKRIILIFVAVTIVQIITIVFWASKKSNFYWDEFYTLQRAHYISATTPADHYINSDSKYETGKWLPVSVVKDTLVIKEAESVLNDPFLSTVKSLFKQDNYCIFLNIINTFIFEGELSIWPAVILNIIIFVLNQIILYLMCKEISKDKYFSIVVTSFYGFTSMCISMTVFVRFYMWATFLTTLFTYFHFKYYKVKDNDYFKKILYLVIAFVALYIDYKSNDFCIFYGAFFIFAFSMILLIEKKMRKFLEYTVPVVIGGTVYLTVINNDFLWILTHLREASECGGALGWAVGQIVNFKKRYLFERTIEMVNNFGKYIFGSTVIMIVFIIFCLIALIIKLNKIKKNEEQTSINYQIILLTVSLVLYFGFFTAFKLYEQIRYVSYVFPEAVIIVVAIMFYLFGNKEKYLASAILIIAMIISVFCGRKVDMLYESDGDFINDIKEKNIDSLVVCADYMPTQISYQPVVFMDDEDEFFVYSLDHRDELTNLADNKRNELLIMSYTGLNIDDVLNLLKENGYTITEIGNIQSYSFNQAVLNN